jgi:hypothetical protein
MQQTQPAQAVVAAAALLVASALIYALAAWTLGHDGPWLDPAAPLSIHPRARMNAVLLVLLIFTHATSYFEMRAIARDLETLRPHLTLTPAEVDALAARARAAGRYRHVLVLATGAALGVMIELGAELVNASPVLETPQDFVRLALMLTLFALLASRTQQTLAFARFFSALGRSHSRVSLFDQEPLRVYGRRGLRVALNWFVGSAIASLLAIDAKEPSLVAAVIAVTLGLGAASLVLPARGVHAALHAAKRDELRRVRDEIERGGAALLAGGNPPEAARLPALIAYESRIGAAREWPIDLPMLLRFGLLAALATGSWLGGAVVERILSAWLS